MMEGNSLVNQPVFIVGAGRSGTTLLYKLLCMHPDVAWVSNYVNKVPSCPWLSVLNRVNQTDRKKCREVWFSKKSNAYFINKSVLKRLYPIPVEGENIYSYCSIPSLKNEPWEITEKQIFCLRKMFKQITIYQGGKFIISKRTANNRRIPQLVNTFPNAFFIHLVRDGRAVSRSLMNVKWWSEHRVWWLNNKKPSEWTEEGKDQIYIAAKNWVEEIKAIRNGLRKVKSNKILEIKYEDLAIDFEGIIKNIMSFINLKKEKAWYEEIRKIRILNQNKVKHNDRLLNNESWIEKVTKIQEDLLKEMKYI
ncbi:sulfotransferase [bacterium]|nr:sulfotransferase [bacterium]